jgi:hypothetical protein
MNEQLQVQMAQLGSNEVPVSRSQPDTLSRVVSGPAFEALYVHDSRVAREN